MKPSVEIEYCPGCRWLLRAGWTAQELLTTFETELGGVTLRPSGVSGTFRVTVGDDLIWNRKDEGRFPEMKELKQRLRDRIAPQRDLGHSDVGDITKNG
jgi:selenoprotein W-related protein